MKQPLPETANPVYTQCRKCRICGSIKLNHVLTMGDHYISNFVKDKNPLDPKAPLEMIQCGGCGLLQLKHSVDKSLLWGDHYWYRSSVNETMRTALRDVVEDGLSYHGVGTWLDIGANDGYLVSQVPPPFRKIACEPSVPFHGNLEEHADRVVPTFFSADAVAEPCNVITSCAMFYDLDDPGAFVRDIEKTLAKDGIWINQLTSTRAMLQKTDFPNICHEHRLYLSENDIQNLYARHGLSVIKILHNDVNGGSIRVVAKRTRESSAYSPAIPKLRGEDILDFVERVRRWKQLMEWVFDALHMSGRTMWGYAASTKAGTLLQFLDRSQYLMGIADRNPQKYGLQMPGVWVPIVDEATMRKAKPDVLVGLAWAFKQEMMEREAELRSNGTVFLWPLSEVTLSI